MYPKLIGGYYHAGKGDPLPVRLQQIILDSNDSIQF